MAFGESSAILLTTKSIPDFGEEEIARTHEFYNEKTDFNLTRGGISARQFVKFNKRAKAFTKKARKVIENRKSDKTPAEKS